MSSLVETSLPVELDEESLKNQLEVTGLKKSMQAALVGGSSSSAPRLMSEILGSKGKLTIVQSIHSQTETREALKGQRNIQFVSSHFDKIKIDSESIDYTFSRYLFGYLPEPRDVFEELNRITKVGGRLVIAELDHHSMSHYPIAPHLELQIRKIASELYKHKLFDAYAGRKLFSYFNEAKFENIRVHLFAHRLIYGTYKQEEIDAWQSRLASIEELVKRGEIDIEFDISVFKNEFFAFFDNPSRFSYSPLFVVEGIKPKA